MPEDAVTIRLRLQGAQKAAAEAHEVAAAIDEIGDEARQADRHLGGFGSAATLLSGPMRLLTSSVGSTNKALKEMFPRIGTIGSAAVRAAPVLLTLAGALIAIAGSAGAALAGAGAIGLGGIAALGVGLAGVGILAGQAAGNFKTVSTALDAYRLVIARYGKESKEARAAQEQLNAVVKQSGGQSILRAVRAWRSLGTVFRRQTGPARGALGGIFGDAIGAARQLVPTFAAVTNQAARALRPAFAGLFAALSGSEAQSGLRDLGNVFARIAGPIGRGVTGIFQALLRVARAAGPFVVRLADGFARFGKGLAAATSSSSTVSGVIGTLVGHLRSWWELAKAVGAVMVTLFTGGASTGKSLVDSLTGIVRGFNEWLKVILPRALPVIGALVGALLKVGEVLFRIAAAWGDFQGTVGKVFSALSGLATQWAGTVKGAFEGVRTAVVSVLDFLIGQVNAVIGGINSIPDIHTPLGNIGVPRIAPIAPIGGQAAPHGGRRAVQRAAAERFNQQLALVGVPPIDVHNTLMMDGQVAARSVTRAHSKKRARK